MFANDHIRVLKPYKVASHRAWEFGANSGVLKLDWNEATVPPTPLVARRVAEFLESGNLQWYPNIKNDELTGAIARYCGVPDSQVLYFASSDSVHEYISRVYLGPARRTLMVSPTYDNFRLCVESQGATVEHHYLGENFTFDVAQLLARIAESMPSMVYICNPNNPTGTLISFDDIELLVSSFPQVLFVVDEAYYEFCGVTSAALAARHNNILVTRTFSKAFALASFRIGYVISCEENIRSLSKVRNSKSASQLSQIAALAALEDLAYTKSYVDDVGHGKRVLAEGLRKFDEIEAVHVGAGNFVLLRMAEGTRDRLVSYLEGNRVFVRSFDHVYPLTSHVRISVGTPAQMEHVLCLMAEFLRKAAA